MADEDVDLVFEEAREAMDKAVESLRKDLQTIRTGRASTALLDGLIVEYFGAPTHINQLANLSAPDPRMLMISPFDKTTIVPIEKAIRSSDLGLSPANDGKVIRLSIPPLTEERRKQLVKQVKKLAEDHKVGVRESRRAAMAMLKDLESDGLPKDDRRRADKRVQDLTDAYVGKIDEVAAQKEAEVLEV